MKFLKIPSWKKYTILSLKCTVTWLVLCLWAMFLTVGMKDKGFVKWWIKFVCYFCLWIIVWKKKEKETRRVTASSTAGILVTLISACIFSLLFSVHFSWYWWWEFVEQTRFDFHFSHDLYVWLSSVAVRTILLSILKDKSWNFPVQWSKHQSGECF